MWNTSCIQMYMKRCVKSNQIDSKKEKQAYSGQGWRVASGDTSKLGRAVIGWFRATPTRVLMPYPRPRLKDLAHSPQTRKQTPADLHLFQHSSSQQQQQQVCGTSCEKCHFTTVSTCRSEHAG